AQLTATVLPSDATDKSIAWSSSNTAVATVSNAGLVSYIAPGTATITAKNEASGVTATCAVTVTAPPTPDPDPEPTPDPDLTAIYAALTTIQFSTINIPQSAGNTETEIAAWLTSYLNTQFEQLQYYVTVSALTFSAFEPAAEGTAANVEGTNGAVTFSANFAKGSQSVLASYLYGTIVATKFTSGNEAAAAGSLKAVSEGGALLISGLTPGDELKVYNATGQLVYSAKADAAEVRLDAARGVYIVSSGKSTIKAIAK
ncbi:MAG: Ig-like domain-containing protein, partial [Tannerellaceae bacterium]|nr:Ig-like domain-containing protein [Tannerellaceae bacterium]